MPGISRVSWDNRNGPESACNTIRGLTRSTGLIREGLPDMVPKISPAATLDDRFWSRVRKSDRCWEWDGAHLASGYGSFRHQGQARVVHRLTYEATFGPIQDGLQIDHLCRNRGCCNPDHLEAVSQKINLLRGVGFSAENARKERCPDGHIYDAINYRGDRECSTCKRMRRRKHYEANSIATKPAAKDRTHCPSGHPYSSENTRITKEGYRKCRACQAERRRATALLLGSRGHIHQEEV